MSPILQVKSLNDEIVEIDLDLANMSYETGWKISSFINYLPIKKIKNVGYALREPLQYSRIKSMSIDGNIIFEVTEINDTKLVKVFEKNEVYKWCPFIMEKYNAMALKMDEILKNPQANMEEYNAIIASKAAFKSDSPINFQGGSSQKKLKTVNGKNTKKQLGGAKTKTDKHIMVGNVKRCVYEGPKGGKYVKQNGEFVSVTALKKK